MSITTLSQLETAVADRLARSDFTAAQIDECIAFAEARMQRQLRALDMETKDANLNLSAEYINVPADFLEVRDLYLNTSPRTNICYLPPELITSLYSSAASGKPKYFSVVGKQFRFGPPPGSGYTATLLYYARIPKLSTTNVTNWVLDQHPDAYLYGALMEAAIRLQDTQAATGYGNLFAQALDAIQGSNNRGRWTGPAMAVRVA